VWLQAAAAELVSRSRRRSQGRTAIEFDPILLWPRLGDWRFGLGLAVAMILGSTLFSAAELQPPNLGRDVLGTVWQVQGALL
jgi:hypothetical protein